MKLDDLNLTDQAHANFAQSYAIRYLFIYIANHKLPNNNIACDSMTSPYDNIIETSVSSSSCTIIARATGYVYKKIRDWNPGIGERSGY
jgi:hypothetical protein